MKNEFDKLFENHYGLSQKDLLNLESLYSLIEEQMGATNKIKKHVLEEGQASFSVTIPIPRLTPSEAWGDPDSQSRQEINRIFRSVTGGQNMKARIESINKFLDPNSAKNKRSPSLIINMMMIVEALQATLNDYNESASGFVFEGFMAALTGGKQIAGKVAGTLPIEDFVAFSEFGADVPVSLKLLKAEGNVKGSFTNLVDFLLVRGAPSIKYLITYKTTTSGGVEGLMFFDFDITRENFVEFIVGTKGDNLIEASDKSFSQDEAKQTFAAYASNPEENFSNLAGMVVKMKGYKKAGLLHNYVETGELKDFTPEEEAEEQAAKDVKALASQEKVRRDIQKMNEMLDSDSISYNQGFHQMEKLLVQEENVLNENRGGDTKSQWSASWAQMRALSSATNMQVYGELDLSQQNIEELSQIYSDILGDEITSLLKETKELTDNIGTYYSAKKRSQAQNAGKVAQKSAGEIRQLLEGDPRYKK